MLLGAVTGLMCLGFDFGCFCLMFALVDTGMVGFIVLVRVLLCFACFGLYVCV